MDFKDTLKEIEKHLPCKLGDTVWEVDYESDFIDHYQVSNITITHHGIGFEDPYFGRGFDLKDFGVTVFSNKKDAKKALTKLNSRNIL